MTLGGLVILGVMEIMVPFIVAFALDMIPILATVLDLTASILGTKNALKVLSTLTLVVLQPGCRYAIA
jgi:hypothetical protein